MPVPTPVSEAGLSALIAFAIGGENRVTRVAVTSETVTAEWAIAVQPAASLRNEGMRHDVSKILEVLVFSEVPFRRASLRGTCEFEDTPGRVLPVVQAAYNKITIDAINFATEDAHAVLRMADSLALEGRFAM